MSKCWYCNEELTTANYCDEHIGICTKCYASMFQVSNEFVKGLMDKIADLEVKLAEKEDRFQVHKQNDTQIIQEQTDLIDKLKQQLAEKEKQYQDAVANCVNIANTRAILKLHKVQDRIDDMKSKYDCDIEYQLGANNELTHLWEYINKLIEEMSDGKDV